MTEITKRREAGQEGMNIKGKQREDRGRRGHKERGRLKRNIERGFRK